MAGICWKFEIELDRFIADAGMGIAEMLLLIAPSVYDTVSRLSIRASTRTYLARSAHRKEVRILRHSNR